MPQKKIIAYVVDSLGVDHPDYFQGYGSDRYDIAVTGIGENAAEAYDDALEMLAQSDVDVDSMPKHPRGIRKTDKVEREEVEDADYPDERWYYVGIRCNLEK